MIDRRARKVAARFVLAILLLLGLLPASLRSQPEQEGAVAATDTVSQRPQAKSPTGAMLRSMLFPGWGQWYNGRKVKAGLFFAAESALIARIVITNDELRQAQTEEEKFRARDRRNVTFWWLGGTILLSMIDAYVDAHLSDFDTGPDLSAQVQPVALNGPGVRFGLRVEF